MPATMLCASLWPLMLFLDFRQLVQVMSAAVENQAITYPDLP